jgi:hypothetical protein
MTPKERAELERLLALERRLGEILGRPVPDARALDWTAFARAAEAQADVAHQRQVTAVRVAVAEEREACAACVGAAALRWSDEPQIAAVLRREADAIRARGEGTR